jgi:hypothetical protein
MNEETRVVTFIEAVIRSAMYGLCFQPTTTPHDYVYRAFEHRLEVCVPGETSVIWNRATSHLHSEDPCRLLSRHEAWLRTQPKVHRPFAEMALRGTVPLFEAIYFMCTHPGAVFEREGLWYRYETASGGELFMFDHGERRWERVKGELGLVTPGFALCLPDEMTRDLPPLVGVKLQELRGNNAAL